MIKFLDNTGLAYLWNKITDLLDEKSEKILVESTMPVGGFLPNIVYNLGTLNANTTFSMASATDNTIANIWCWTFTMPSTTITVTFPSGLKWQGGELPELELGNTYEITVMGGVAIIVNASTPE